MLIDMQVSWDRKHLPIWPGEISLRILLRGKNRTEMFVLTAFTLFFGGEAKYKLDYKNYFPVMQCI